MKEIYLYKTASGREIIKEFIDRQNEVSKGRIRNGFRILEKHGLEISKNRSVKKIAKEPDVFELRIVGTKQIRILFSDYDRNTYLVVHIFIKKSQKTLLKEIKLAQKRINEFI